MPLSGERAVTAAYDQLARCMCEAVPACMVAVLELLLLRLTAATGTYAIL
jgi:hypothetical protein